ncbi:MAG: hypothetical protein ACRBFS_05285 [Aureispira sp.]
MHKKKRQFLKGSFLALISVLFLESWKVNPVIRPTEPCLISMKCYAIMQTETTENWAMYFRTGQTLDKDAVDLCLVDSLLEDFAKVYNEHLKKKFVKAFDKEELIEYYRIVLGEYGVQIVPYKHGDKIELLLSCLKRERIKDVNHWKKNYFGMIHERGMDHFYATIDQTARKILSVKP